MATQQQRTSAAYSAAVAAERKAWLAIKNLPATDPTFEDKRQVWIAAAERVRALAFAPKDLN